MILVASYCRVSMDKMDQQRYFREYIDRNPDWELYRVYADEGLSGTSTHRRATANLIASWGVLDYISIILLRRP